jgi:hypothetical protein
MTVASLAYMKVDKYISRCGKAWVLLVAKDGFVTTTWLRDKDRFLSGPTDVRKAKAVASRLLREAPQGPPKVRWSREGTAFRFRF